VGKNNSGKTTVLEAVELLELGDARGLARVAFRRNEELPPAPIRTPQIVPRLDASHLFFGHQLAPGVGFRLRDNGSGREFRVQVSASNGQRALELSSNDQPAQPRVVLPDGLDIRAADEVAGQQRPVRFLDTTAAEDLPLSLLWSRIVLTDAEERVVEALRFVAPKLERIALVNSERPWQIGFRIKHEGTEESLPIGTLGDGVRRMLALSVHLAASPGGVLLVDEIDTGLHHSVMTKMWRLVIETARRLGVQVFATTHSEDCVRALAEAAEQDAAAADDVSLHRIDPGEEETMRYAADDLIVATRRHIEVR